MIIIGDYQALYKGCEIMQDYDGDKIRQSDIFPFANHR